LDPNLQQALEQSPSFWIIAACSVIALAVAVERAIALWGFVGKARQLAESVSDAVRRGDLPEGRSRCERSPSPAADVFLAAIEVSERAGRQAQPADPVRVAAAVERERAQVGLKLRRNLWILGTVGATAPFIGLFGTVVGIMHAFRQMAATGQGGFVVVASGISEALITTAGGIAVAIEAVVIFNFLNVHVQKLALQLRLVTEEYLEVVSDALASIRAGPRPGEGA
jgi:biopolymer transport protein ExbB